MLRGDENAIRASWAAKVERETASHRPLLELSPIRRPFAGMSSSAARVSSHNNYKLTLSSSHTYTPRASSSSGLLINPQIS